MKRNFQSYMPLALIILAGVVYIYSEKQPSQNRTLNHEQRQKMQERVNAHLARTAEQLEMQRKRMQIENQKLALGYNETKAETAYVNPREGAELRNDKRSENLAQDLGLMEMKKASSNPMDMIHHQLFEEQQMRQMDAAYKQEYARQFIENARRGGYEIKLNDEFRVISVKPLRKPTNNPQLFSE